MALRLLRPAHHSKYPSTSSAHTTRAYDYSKLLLTVHLTHAAFLVVSTLSWKASTKPTSIDFQKFETDFMNSRAHHRLARVNRTVGHTSVVLGQTNLAPHHSGAIGIAQSPVSLPTRQPHGCDAKDRAPSPRHRRSGQLDQRRGAHPLQPRQRPASAGQVPLNRPRRGIEGNNQSSKKGPGRKSCGASNDEKASDITALPHRPPAGVEGKRHAVTRPHTASGLRRDGGHHDVLESRAADPGWARGIGVCMAERPSSASARIKWGHWHDDDESYLMKKMRTSRVFRCESKPDMELHRGGREEPDKNPPQLTSIESNDEVEVQEGQKLCLGRTCLGEVKILVKPTSTSGGDANGQGAPRQMTFKCSSLDGLIRQDRRVQRTLRGFVVEVELVPPSRASLNSNFHSNKKGRASVTATVSAVQDLLDNATPSESHGISTATFTDDSVSTLDVSDNLQPFRDALPLDNRGNYPELRALLGREGQRQLLESLLGSCRVELENSNVVGVTLVKLNVGEDPQISVVTKHPSPPP